MLNIQQMRRSALEKMVSDYQQIFAIVIFAFFATVVCCFAIAWLV
jgi:hypothetical protein